MTPSKLRTWLQAHGEPVTIREIAVVRQAQTGTFSEKRIQHSMKALEAAGLVEFELGEHNAKLWKLTPAVDAPPPEDTEEVEPTTGAAGE